MGDGRKLFRALAKAAEGLIPPELAEAVLLAQLEHDCTACGAELRRVDEVSDSARTWLEAWGTRDDYETGDEKVAGLLRDQSWESCFRRVKKSRTALRTPEVVVSLLTRARRCFPTQPLDAEHLIDLAVCAAEGGRAWATPGCAALALAFKGNARRVVGGNLSEADSFLSKALALVAVDPPPPPVAGEVSGLVGSLLKDQRRLGEASDILSATVEQLRKDRDDQLAARLHMILAAVHKHSGKPFLAVEANAQALALLGPLAELRVLLWGWHNHAVYLRDADEWRAASEVFDTLSVLYDLLADRQTMLRRRWLEGLLLSSSSDSENAEAALREVLNGYAEDGAAFPAAMVGLDLSEQLLTEHRWTEVCEIADTLLKVFKTVGVHREATAALLLLAKSAARESLSRALILRLRDFLSRARVDRSLSLDQT